MKKREMKRVLRLAALLITAISMLATSGSFSVFALEENPSVIPIEERVENHIDSFQDSSILDNVKEALDNANDNDTSETVSSDVIEGTLINQILSTEKIPLYGWSDSWSPLNLILLIVNTAMFSVCTLCVYIQKKRYGHQDPNAIIQIVSRSSLAFAAILIFFLTQNTLGILTIFDDQSWILVAITLAHILVALLPRLLKTKVKHI